MPKFVILERTDTRLNCCRLLEEPSAVTQGEMERNGGGGWEARRPAAQPTCQSKMMDEPIPWLVISADWL